MKLRARRSGLLAAVLLGGCGAAHTASTAQRTSAAATPPAVHHKAQRGPVTLTVEVNGDLLIHSPVWETALADGRGHYDFFASTAAEVAIANSAFASSRLPST